MKLYEKIRDKFEAATSADLYRESASKPGRAEYLDPTDNLWKPSSLYKRRDLRNPELFKRVTKQ